MRKVALALLLVGALAFAKCYNLTASIIYLTNNEVVKWYPKLKPGLKTQVRLRTGEVVPLEVLDVKKVMPDYKGWLPAMLVKVKDQQLALCKKFNLTVVKACDGSYYCFQPVQAPLFIYVGNYTELLVKYNVTKGLGNPKAKVWIVELLDPLCPYCSMFYRQGGGKYVMKLVEEGKAYLIPVIVAFHKTAPGYEESLRLAYELNSFVKANNTKAFFKLEEKIAENVVKLYENKMKLSNVKVSKDVLEKANKEKLSLAQKLFPYVATPGNVFVNPKTGKAIAVMGALNENSVKMLIEKVSPKALEG